MKRQIPRIIIVIGFIIMCVGAIIDYAAMENPVFVSIITVYSLSAALAVCFVFAKNGVMQNVGYTLATLVGVNGLISTIVILAKEGDILVSDIGAIVMVVGALFYFIVLVLNFFGFNILRGTAATNEQPLSELLKYKELQKEEVITEEEYEQIKNNVLSSAKPEKYTVEDLKKWKRLLDQQVISEQEFAEIKSRIFAK